MSDGFLLESSRGSMPNEDKDTNGALRQGNFPEILQTAPIMIYEVGSNGCVVGANDALLKWSGYSKEDCFVWKISCNC
jgi:PAS domain-containing protein